MVPAKIFSWSSIIDGTTFPSLIRFVSGAPSVIDRFGPGRSKTLKEDWGIVSTSSRILPEDLRR